MPANEQPSRELLVILDSVRYDRFTEATDLEAYRAYSHGTWTRPSVCSMLSGYLPQSSYGQPYTPCWTMLDNFMLHNRDIPAWFLHSNAWMHNMGPSGYREKYYHQRFAAPTIVEEAGKIMEARERYYVALLLFETHCPYQYNSQAENMGEKFKAYNKGADNGGAELAKKQQRKAIKYMMGLIRPLLDIPGRTIITSDHGDLQGEYSLVGHDPSFPFHYKLVEVPLVVREV